MANTKVTQELIADDAIGSDQLASSVSVAGSARIAQVALTSASTVSWNATSAANAYLSIGHNCTIDTPTNPIEGAIIQIEIAQGGSAYTVAWTASAFEFAASTAPTASGANKTDIFTFRYNGSHWMEIGRSMNMAQS